jgi:predicted flavoprotein YhiN
MLKLKKSLLLMKLIKIIMNTVVKSADNIYKSNSLVIATGGLSVPKIGASSFGKALKNLGDRINSWIVNPTGSEGYRTAEVTLGGVNINEISSKTMMSLKH